MVDAVAKSQALSADEAARITPRAEFRVFGHGVIEAVRERLYNGRTILLQARRLPVETYLLSAPVDDANVKVRDDLLDIKIRVGTTPEGYEIFQPRGKFPLPVSRADLGQAFVHLKVELPLAPERYDLDSLIALARANPELRVVTVEKMRHGFSIDGVVCEYAQVWFNGALIETVCVESEDHTAMTQVIEGLGIGGLPNTSYVRAAKRVVGLV